MLKKTRSPILSSVLNALEKGKLVHQPFSYYQIDDVFPDDFYQSLRNNLPSLKNMEELKHFASKRRDGTYARRILEVVSDKDLKKIPKEIRAPWETIWKLGNHPDYQKKILKMFDSPLKKRYDSKLSPKDLKVKMVISRDLDQYRIQVHPDTARKIVTMQFYLPQDDKYIDNIGTVMHKKIPKEQRLNGQKYQRIEKLKFGRNRGYGFAVTDRSFHSVDLVKLSPNESRDSVTLVFIGTKKSHQKDKLYQLEKKRGKPAS